MDHPGYAYASLGVATTMIVVSIFVVVQVITMQTRLGRHTRKRPPGIHGIDAMLSPTRSRQALLIGATLLVIGIAHWTVPVDQYPLQIVHVIMRKLFIVPVVLGAIWFQMRGALLTAMCMTLIYLPHVMLQWAGQAQENASQLADVLVIWAVAVLAGNLVRRERSALQEVARSHEGAIRALVAALDAREHDTELHSVRVQSYAQRTLKELGLARGNIHALETGALLHDVGKIGVADHILLKSGPLDEAEQQAMRRHPEIGRDILRSARLHPQSLEIVYLHHERHDGSGYPLGLRGADIPILVRVFAIADAFDAITSARPYKQALSVETARQRIMEGRGSHFDPEIVDAFMRVTADEWRDIAGRLHNPPVPSEAGNTQAGGDTATE